MLVHVLLIKALCLLCFFCKNLSIGPYSKRTPPLPHECPDF